MRSTEMRDVLIALGAGAIALVSSTLLSTLLIGVWRGPGVGAVLAGVAVAGYVYWVRRRRRSAP